MPAERVDTTAHDATLRAAFNAADTHGRIVGVRIINIAANNQYGLVADRDPTTITCFVAGRMIETKYGQVAVENPKLRPIRIKVGSLGPSLPERDLEVSP